MEKALIFGVNSQDGYYLSQICRQHAIDCIGVARSEGDWLNGSVSDFGFVESLIKTHQPAYVFHIAAASTTRHDALFENHETISTGAINVLEAVKRHHPSARVFITGSGVQFENHGRPINETDAFEGSSPYAVARIQSVYAARYYRTLGVRAYVGYLFHHESPLRKSGHVSKKIVEAVIRIAQGSPETLDIGDVSVRKEWTFAGDVAKGIFALMQQEHHFEATIGSGQAHSIEAWLDTCFGLVKRDWRDHTRIVQGYKSDYPVLVSDPATINGLGWQSECSFEALAVMMMQAGGM